MGERTSGWTGFYSELDESVLDVINERMRVSAEFVSMLINQDYVCVVFF